MTIKIQQLNKVSGVSLKNACCPWFAGLLLLSFSCALTAQMNIEALDGGVVDLSGIKQIIGTGNGVHINVDGENSVVDLSSLENFIDSNELPGSTIEVLNQGHLNFGSAETALGNRVTLNVANDATISASSLALQAGSSLFGGGSINADVSNAGLISPGTEETPNGVISISGAYTQLAGSELQMDYAGSNAGTDHDFLDVAGAVELDGKYTLSAGSGFVPDVDTSTKFINSLSRTGEFETVSGLTLSSGGVFEANYTDTGFELFASGPGFIDIAGPAINSVTYQGQPVVDGLVITQSGALNVSAVDPSGLVRLEVLVDEEMLGTDVSGDDPSTVFWPIYKDPDGSRTLAIRAYDSFGNQTQRTFTVSTQLAAPSVPTISSPTDGTLTNKAQTTVSGQAVAGSEVVLYVNDVAVPERATVDSSGTFEGSAPLQSGVNQISVLATNRGGNSPRSDSIEVTFDGTIPAAPRILTADAGENGAINLNWSSVGSSTSNRFNVFRSADPFSEIAVAQVINAEPIGTTSYADFPQTQQPYYYRVVAQNVAGSTSLPSNLAHASADDLAPHAVSISYSPSGAYDSISGRIGAGRVDVNVVVSEPLLTTPFFSIAPNQGVPISIELTQESETEYSGYFEITASTPSGTAYAVFSARDKANNRGTEIIEGTTIEIDTLGPVVEVLAITPADPIKNDVASPVTIDVLIELSEPLATGETPKLSYALSQSLADPVLINLSPVNETSWQGSIPLTADVAESEVVNLSFEYQGVDDLGNISEHIQGQRFFQIYQGDLPPQPIPQDLMAESLANGRVQLSWSAVSGAVDYQLYRQAPGETELTPFIRTSGANSWADTTELDGEYRYSIASVRSANQQEAISAQSQPVSVLTDSIPPSAPLNLTLELTPRGILAMWAPPAGNDELHYRLYRSAESSIDSVVALEPVKSEISVLQALDASPTDDMHTYVVTSVDQAGNESVPSESVYLNFDLLPVSSIDIEYTQGAYPLISWTHPSQGIAGFDLFAEIDGVDVKLNASLLTGTSFEDVGYTGVERKYTLVAYDSIGESSLARSLIMPNLSINPISQEPIQRGLMNRLQYSVVSQSGVVLEEAQLKITHLAGSQFSLPFSVQPGSETPVDVVIGGSELFPPSMTLDASVHWHPSPGETVRITQSHTIDVINGALALDVQSRTLTRGTNGEVKFTIDNTSDVEIEIVTATQNGSKASNGLHLRLLTVDDQNVLSTQSLLQATGEDVVTLPNGTTVARIAAGARFESPWISMTVGETLPDEALLELIVDQLHYRLGQPDEASVIGGSVDKLVSLAETPYSGSILAITPEQSFGDQNIIISGAAIQRESGEPAIGVPLLLVLQNDGFERRFDVITDAAGQFEYEFIPAEAESGVFHVSAIHPGSNSRPEHGVFVVGRVLVDSYTKAISLPKGVPQNIDFTLTAGRGTSATGARLVLLDEDQPLGSVPEGLSVSIGNPVDIDAGESSSITITLQGDADTDPVGSLFFQVQSNESGASNLGTVRLDYRFSAAESFLVANPGFIETGVTFNASVSEEITFSNQGLADLKNASIQLLTPTGDAAPNWIFQTSSTEIESLPIGEETTVGLFISPNTAVSVGLYEFVLRVTGSDIEDTDFDVFVTVIEDGIGNIVFHASDIYTATLDDEGIPIPGLAGANVRIQNEDILSIDQTLVTDELGEALFSDLPAGRYRYRVRAPNHEDRSGFFWIKAGLTVTQEVFLNYQLISVEWSVTEITIEDRYEIILDLTYETDVPAPVVVIEPAVVNLPNMSRGEVFLGEFTITNYGLIRAENLRFSLPAINDEYRVELMQDIPDSLNAKDRITVPYRLVALSDFDASSKGDAGAGGSSSCGGSGAYLRHSYICANGTSASGGSSIRWVTPGDNGGSCGLGGHSTSGGGGTPGGGGGWSPRGQGGSGCAPGFSCASESSGQGG